MRTLLFYVLVLIHLFLYFIAGQFLLGAMSVDLNIGQELNWFQFSKIFLFMSSIYLLAHLSAYFWRLKIKPTNANDEHENDDSKTSSASATPNVEILESEKRKDSLYDVISDS